MVGMASLAESLMGEEAAASGIGRNFRMGWCRRGRRGKPRLYDNGVFGLGGGSGFGSRSRGFGGLGFGGRKLLGGRRVEDAACERSERFLERRQNLRLLPFEGIDFGFDLGAEFVRGAAELVHDAPDLAADLRQFLGAEKDQRQEKQEDHLTREAEIHTGIIMRQGGR